LWICELTGSQLYFIVGEPGC